MDCLNFRGKEMRHIVEKDYYCKNCDVEFNCDHPRVKFCPSCGNRDLVYHGDCYESDKNEYELGKGNNSKKNKKLYESAYVRIYFQDVDNCIKFDRWLYWNSDGIDFETLIDKINDYLECSDVDDYTFGKDGDENDYRKSVKEFIEDFN